MENYTFKFKIATDLSVHFQLVLQLLKFSRNSTFGFAAALNAFSSKNCVY
jgi:hypothetical protein